MVVIAIVSLAIPVGIMVFGGFDDDGSGSTTAAATESSGPGAIGAVAILGFIALSFVGSGFLARTILRNTTRSGVIENGVDARGTIISMTETGTTVNQNPMVEFGVRVERDGHAPYDATMKQVLPRLLLARVQPGLAVPVKVLANNPNEVAIDFNTLASGGGGSAGVGASGAGLTAAAVATAPTTGTIDTDAFLVRAIPAMAEIDEMAQANRTATNPRSGETFEVYSFVLTVQRDGHAPYPAPLLQGVPAEHIGTFGPGATVPVGISPDDPSDIAINWRELERQRRSGRS